MNGPHMCPKCGQIKMLEFRRVGNEWAWVWYCIGCGDAVKASMWHEKDQDSRE